jgi:hypothetical protein
LVALTWVTVKGNDLTGAPPVAPEHGPTGAHDGGRPGGRNGLGCSPPSVSARKTAETASARLGEPRRPSGAERSRPKNPTGPSYQEALLHRSQMPARQPDHVAHDEGLPMFTGASSSAQLASGLLEVPGRGRGRADPVAALSDGLALQLRLRPRFKRQLGAVAPAAITPASQPMSAQRGLPNGGAGVRVERLAWLVGNQFGFLELTAEGERRPRVTPILSPERSVHDRPRGGQGSSSIGSRGRAFPGRRLALPRWDSGARHRRNATPRAGCCLHRACRGHLNDSEQGTAGSCTLGSGHRKRSQHFR